MDEQSVLKSLGFTTEARSLIQTSHDTTGAIIEKSLNAADQYGRVGRPGNARDRLEASLTPTPGLKKGYGDENLKDTHGEKFHGDNDKQVEKLNTTAEEIDSVHPIDEQENTKIRQGKKTRQKEFQEDAETRHPKRPEPVGAIKRSLSQDELFLKALDGLTPLVETTPDRQEDRQEPAKVAKSIGKGPLVEWAKEEEVEHKKPEKIVKKIAKSALDELCSIIKGEDDSLVEVIPDQNDPDVIANVHENSVEIQPHRAEPTLKSQIPFLKSAGAGGYLFDFGHKTGNPVADNATALLNRHADPTQAAIAASQTQGYNQAIREFVSKGQSKFAGGDFGAVNNEWAAQMNKPLDQQVKEAHEAGQLAKGGPAVVNQFNEVQTEINGEMVKATSPTDAAVLEMFKAEQAAMNEPGMVVADARFGGAQSVTIDAESGTVLQ